ncbi:ABC transporter permease [Streptococcus orisratti]|uniref:ABC transporter permease n=2 Tax=Streptococcus orisratti TaxID=114652 RepID=UPI0023FA3399|nr:ABC transporter permease [Streptococcus orisratti]
MKYAFKEILFYKKKYFLVEGLVIFMIFMVMFLSGLTNGLGQAVSSGIEQLDTQYFIINEDAEGIIPYSTLTEAQQADILDLDLSDTEELNIQRSTLTLQGEKDKLEVTYFVLGNESTLLPKLTTGKSFSSKSNGIVLDESFKADGIEVGDKVKDKNGETSFVVTGFTKGYMYGHSSVGFISQASYSSLVKVSNPNYSFSPQVIMSKDKSLKTATISKAEVKTKSGIINKIPGYSAEQSTLQMILWVLVVASVAILAVFFYIITLEKRQQFGVLKAIGMPMSAIASQQISQVFLLSLIGVIFGDLLSLAMARILPVKMPFYLQWQNMGIISLVFVVVTVLSSLVSIHRVSRIDPVEIINGGEE